MIATACCGSAWACGRRVAADLVVGRGPLHGERRMRPLWPNSYRMPWLPNRHRVILHQPVYGSRLRGDLAVQRRHLEPIATARLRAAGAGFDLALDPSLDKLVLFGGQGAAATASRTDWTLTSPAVCARRGATATPCVLDVARGRVVMFGGRTGVVDGPQRRDLGVGWRHLAAAHAESQHAAPRENHRMTFDGARRRARLHGGDNPVGHDGGTLGVGHCAMDRASDGHPLAAALPALLAHDLRGGCDPCIGLERRGHVGTRPDRGPVSWVVRHRVRRQPGPPVESVAEARAGGRTSASTSSFGCCSCRARWRSVSSGFSNTNWAGVGAAAYTWRRSAPPGCELRVDPPSSPCCRCLRSGHLEPAAAGGPRTESACGSSPRCWRSTRRVPTAWR